MKKYKLNLKENEEMIVDVDDLMATELVKFKEAIKDLNETEIKIFDNWVKIYKILNYDIIDNLQVEKVYKFNECSAVVEITFRGVTEYDLLNLNPETMTVACMNVKNNSVRNYVTRRLLIPDTIEEALSFAKSDLPEEGIKAITKTIDSIKKHGDKYNVTQLIKIYDPEFKRVEEPKVETQEEPKVETQEQPKEEPKREPRILNVATRNNNENKKPKYNDIDDPRRHVNNLFDPENRNPDGSLNMRKYLFSTFR